MSDRKKDHINLAFQSQTEHTLADPRFYYEPLLGVHHKNTLQTTFATKQMRAPIWISSMTGGTQMAAIINKRLARVAEKFGLGMGLGSCRMLMESNQYFEDFNVRKYIGHQQLLYANLGVAQIQEYLETNRIQQVNELIERLQADGLIIHVNPMQELFQPEGDQFKIAPIDTIKEALKYIKTGIIVKEVGQGLGYESLKQLLKLNIQAIDFGAFGGTNFAKLELLRGAEENLDLFEGLSHIGHTANDMVNIYNQIIVEENLENNKQVIISGGIKNYLDGYYLTQKIKANAIYGQASAFLKYALQGEEQLFAYAQQQINGLQIANDFLTIRQ